MFCRRLPLLLVAPSAVFIQRTDRAHNMKVGIGNTAYRNSVNGHGYIFKTL